MPLGCAFLIIGFPLVVAAWVVFDVWWPFWIFFASFVWQLGVKAPRTTKKRRPFVDPLL